jgi:hypothetical protein
MMTAPSNGQIYEVVNQARLESKADNLRLDAKLDILRNDVDKLKTSNATLSIKVVALLSVISLFSSAIVYALAATYVGRL